MFIIKINTEDFEKIKSKEKYLETGLAKSPLGEINVGNTILFKKEPDLIEGVVAKVTDIKYYNSFFEMAKVLSIKALGKDGMDAKGVADFYVNKFGEEQEKLQGVIAIKFELI